MKYEYNGWHTLKTEYLNSYDRNKNNNDDEIKSRKPQGVFLCF